MAGNMVDNSLLVKQLTADDFAPARFVRDATQQCIGIGDLRQYRRRLATLADTTGDELKRHVFRNYRQLIDTAREIQHLEAEMYQLTHRLTEQRSLLVSLSAASGAAAATAAASTEPANTAQASSSDTAASGKNSDDTSELSLSAEAVENGRRRLLQLADTVDGVIDADVCRQPGRHLLFDSELLELNPSTMTAVGRLRGYLFNDALMTACWLAERRGGVRHRLDALYRLDALALVNVRDDGGSGDGRTLQNAVKLLLTDSKGHSDSGADGGVRVLQCANADIKRMWLQQVDAAKRRRLEQQQRERQARERHLPCSSSASVLSPAGRRPADAREMTGVTASQAKSQQDGDKQTETEACDDVELVEDLVPDWLLEAAEHLDVLLAERRLQEALDILRESHTCIDRLPVSIRQRDQLLDVQRQLAERRSCLCQQLLNELHTSSNCCHQLSLLFQLDSGRRACQLLLRHRSQQLRQQLRRQLRASSGAQQLVRSLVGAVATVIVATTRHLDAVLSAHSDEAPGCRSLLAVWCREEMAFLLALFVRHVFGSAGGTGGGAGGGGGVKLSQLADCVQLMHAQLSAELAAVGLDCKQQVAAALRRHLARVAAEAGRQLVDAVRMRAGDDQWRPLDGESLNNNGRVTANCAAFAAAVSQYTDNLCRLYTGSAVPIDCQRHLAAVFSAQLQHLQRARSQSRPERPLVDASWNYVANTVLDDIVQRLVRARSAGDCGVLLAVRGEFQCNGVQV